MWASQKPSQRGHHLGTGKKNREFASYALISKALTPTSFIVGNVEEKKPLLTIMRGCRDNHILVQQFKSLRFKEFKGTVIDKDRPSDPMDEDRHLIDRPRIRNAGPEKRPRSRPYSV